MMNAVVKPYHEMCLNSSELIVPRGTYQRALHPARQILLRYGQHERGEEHADKCRAARSVRCCSGTSHGKVLQLRSS